MRVYSVQPSVVNCTQKTDSYMSCKQTIQNDSLVISNQPSFEGGSVKIPKKLWSEVQQYWQLSDEDIKAIKAALMPRIEKLANDFNVHFKIGKNDYKVYRGSWGRDFDDGGIEAYSYEPATLVANVIARKDGALNYLFGRRATATANCKRGVTYTSSTSVVTDIDKTKSNIIDGLYSAFEKAADSLK